VENNKTYVGNVLLFCRSQQSNHSNWCFFWLFNEIF